MGAVNMRARHVAAPELDLTGVLLRVHAHQDCAQMPAACVRMQVAAALSSGDCLVLTELLFNGTLTPLSPIQLAALASCFVWSEASDRGTPRVRDDLQV